MVCGGCLCGTVRYELTAASSSIVDCHCSDCRRSSGAPFVTWVSVKRQHLHFVSGEIRRVEVANRIRSFAICCGSPLVFEDSPETEDIEITVGTLDHPEAFPTCKSTWLEDRLPWVVIDSSLPQFQRGSQPQD